MKAIRTGLTIVLGLVGGWFFFDTFNRMPGTLVGMAFMLRAMVYCIAGFCSGLLYRTQWRWFLSPLDFAMVVSLTWAFTGIASYGWGLLLHPRWADVAGALGGVAGVIGLVSILHTVALVGLRLGEKIAETNAKTA